MAIGNSVNFDCIDRQEANGTNILQNETCQVQITGNNMAPLPALIDSNYTLATIYVGIMATALLLGTFGNIMILAVAALGRGLNKIGKEFMVNLALADLCVASIADPMCIVGVLKGEHFFNGLPWLCHLVASLCLTACFCAFMSLTMLSVNRFVYLCHNSIYDKIYGRIRCIALCVLCWVVAFLCEFPNFIGWGGHYFDQKNHQCIWDRTSSLSYTLFVALGLIGSPLALMTICYVLIFRHIWNTKKTLYDIDTVKHERMGKIMKETARTSKTLFAIFMVFVICWTPYAIVIAMDVENQLSVEIHLMITLLAHLHSSCNFVIYFISNKRFRMAIGRICGCVDTTPVIESETKSSNFRDATVVTTSCQLKRKSELLRNLSAGSDNGHM